MNILHITKYSMLKGGVAKVIKELATRTIENGDNAIVLSSCTEDHNNCVDGIQLLHEDFPTPGVHFFRNRRLLDKIVGICKQYNVDIIHCHGAYRAGFVGYVRIVL